MSRLQHTRLSLVISALVLITLSGLATGQEDVYDHWAKHDPSQTFELNHDPMSQILGFITESSKGRDKYSYFKLQGGALDYLNKYKAYLEQIPVSQLNQNEQLAYWLNLHNLLVIEKFANNLKNAKRINRKRGTPEKAGKWWSEKVAIVEGISLSINDIEQNVLARHWDTPLFLYGLIYGARGQSFTGKQGFAGKTVINQLEDMAVKFIENDDNVKIKKDEVAISSLLAWNKATVFNNDPLQVIGHIKTHARGNKAEKLASVNAIRDKHDFDWKSLAQRPPRQNSRNDASNVNTSTPVYRGGS